MTKKHILQENYERLFKTRLNEREAGNIEYWDIPKKIRDLEWDGDKSDLRLFHNCGMYNFHWGEKEEKDYQKVEKKLDKFEIKGSGYAICLGYDVSGWDYWMNKQEETNYVNIIIEFTAKDFPVKQLSTLKKDYRKAVGFAKDIQYDHDYDPNE